MKKLIGIAILFLASNLAYAQRPDQIELNCPAGSSPTWGGQSFDLSTGKYRQWQCVDRNGNVYSSSSSISGQFYNVVSYGALSGDSVDSTTAIQNTFNAAIAASPTTNGAIIIIPPGTYLINTTTNDPTYGKYMLELVNALHIKIFGYGATLDFRPADNNTRSFMIMGSGSCNIEGLKIINGSGSKVGTGLSFRRPTVAFDQPVQKNVFTNGEIWNFNLGVEMGTTENNQVSENTITQTIFTGNTIGILQQGTDTFNMLYLANTFYVGTATNPLFYEFAKGTATIERNTLEATSANAQGFKLDSLYVGPLRISGLYAEIQESAGNAYPFFVWNANGAFVNIYDSQFSFFGADGTQGSPYTGFDLTGGGGNLTFTGSSWSTPNNGWWAIKQLATPAVDTIRYHGFWSPNFEFFGNTVNDDLPYISSEGIANMTNYGFENGANISDEGSSSSSMTVNLPSSPGGTPTARFRFTGNTFQPIANDTAVAGTSSLEFLTMQTKYMYVNNSIHWGTSGSTIVDYYGSGAPTGTCVTGSTYRRSDGGAGTSFYVCESTSWVGK